KFGEEVQALFEEYPVSKLFYSPDEMDRITSLSRWCGNETGSGQSSLLICPDTSPGARNLVQIIWLGRSRSGCWSSAAAQRR
ncbi:hypothetical protein ACYCH7_23435, partial [Klebsiella pneumoniae]